MEQEDLIESCNTMEAIYEAGQNKKKVLKWNLQPTIDLVNSIFQY